MLNAQVSGAGIGHVVVSIPLYRQLPSSRKHLDRQKNGGPFAIGG
jgi:hypothetical protein